MAKKKKKAARRRKEKRVYHQLSKKQRAVLEELKFTEREMDVIVLVGKGMTMQEIADEIERSYNTVKLYCDRLRKKLNLRRKVEIAIWFMTNVKSV
jgi:DNA-binding NarL/FixJ family response regulator